jgi:GTP 3',8-cyclase
MTTLHDAFGRHIEYLRLSVTQRCNFRCVYCLPQGCPVETGSPVLSLVEIERLARAFAQLGVWKIRLTGGEPTLRRDIADIVACVAGVSGIRRVGLTTNGYRLLDLAPTLRESGLASLNVSVDSLDQARFERLTGYPRLERVVDGVEAALSAGIPSVKVNVVLMQGFCDRELDLFLDWTKRLPLVVRFIELMQTGENGAFFRANHVSAEGIRRKLDARGWTKLPREESDGPATNYGHHRHTGKVGLIAPYSAGFCETCNRVRVSSAGDLRLCLFHREEIPLRPMLQSSTLVDELVRLVASAIAAKPASHRLQHGECKGPTNLASIGG